VEWTEAGPRPRDKAGWIACGCFVMLALGALAAFGLAVYGFLKLFSLI